MKACSLIAYAWILGAAAIAAAGSFDVEWEKVIRFDSALSQFPKLAAVMENNFFLVSAIQSGENRSFVIFKGDSGGKIQVADSLTVSGAVLEELTPTAEGGAIAVGYKGYPLHESSMFLMLLDRNGKVVWDTLYDKTPYGDYGNAVIQTDDGGFITAGISGKNSSDTTGSDTASVWIAYIDGQGRIVRDTAFKVKNFTGVIDVVESENGYVFAISLSEVHLSSDRSPWASYHTSIIKLNRNFEKQWEKYYPLIPSTTIVEDRSHNLLVCGNRNSYGNISSRDTSYLSFFCLDKDGDSLWHFALPHYNRIVVLKSSTVGDTFVVLSWLGNGTRLTGLNAGGDIFWDDSQLTMVNGSDKGANDFCPIPDGSFLFAGYAGRYGYTMDSLFICKLVPADPTPIIGAGAGDIRKSGGRDNPLRILRKNNTLYLSGIIGNRLEFTLYDINGKRLSAPAVHRAGNSAVTIPLTGRALAAGVSILRVKTGDGEATLPVIDVSP